MDLPDVELRGREESSSKSLSSNHLKISIKWLRLARRIPIARSIQAI
jgi:hypothetical protein